MEQSLTWEADRFSASQEISRFLCNPKVRFRIHKFPPPVTILSISPGPRITVWMFRNRMRFYGEELLAPRPTTKLEDHPLSAVRDCLFNIFAATLHIGGRSFIDELITRLAVSYWVFVCLILWYLETSTMRRPRRYLGCNDTDIIGIFINCDWVDTRWQ
jgi:hypothetical protein